MNPSSVKTFRARSMPEALALVKRELGPHAIILGTRHLGGGLSALTGAARVEITAAPGAPVERPPSAVSRDGRQPPPAVHPRHSERSPRHSEPNPRQPEPNPRHSERPPTLPDELLPFYQQLVASEVAEHLAIQLAKEAASEAIQNPKSKIQNPDVTTRDALRTAIARRIPAAGGIELSPDTTRRVVLIGPPGGGKTTTLAKLAAHFALRLKNSVAILSLDMHRLATHDQVRRYADLIGVPVFTAQTVSAVRDVIKSLPAVDLLLIDTHGVSPRDHGRFARLAALLRAAKADETHLVLPASLAASVRDAMIRTFAPLGVSRVAITKLDEAVGLGVVLNALEKLNWGLSYITDGQRVPTDLHEVDPADLAARLLPSHV